jgi:hypothetical protein
MMHPQTAMALTDQRREELIRQVAETRQARAAGTSWPGRHLPRWRVTWTRTVLSSAAGPETNGGHPDRRGRRGSSLVIIISSYH